MNKKLTVLLCLFLLFKINAQKRTNHKKHNSFESIKEVFYKINKENPPVELDHILNEPNLHLKSFSIKNTKFNKGQNITKSKLIQVKKGKEISNITTTYERNKKKNISRIIKENTNGEIEEKSVLTYNNYHKLLEVKTYDKKNNLLKTQKNYYKYNLLIKREVINFDKKEKVKYFFDNKGFKTEQLNFPSDKKLKSKRTYKYDKNGNEIEQVVFKQNKITYKIISEYNKFNDLILKTYFDAEGNATKKITYSISYNSQNDWIQKIEIFNTIRTRTWAREITYF